MPIRTIVSKLKEAYAKHFTLKEPEDVVISGLGTYDKMFKESMTEQAEIALEKMRRDLPISSFQIHVKSTMHAEGKQLFEMNGKLVLEDNKELHAKIANRDPLYALKFLIRDLHSQVLRTQSKLKERPKRKFYK